MKDIALALGFMLVLAAGRKSSSEKGVGVRNRVVNAWTGVAGPRGDVALLAVACVA